MITPHTLIQKPVHARQYGFSLIEVLIALLVLAIGLLGLAGLQTFSVKFVHQSYQRTQATLLIYEMIDRMRANGAGVMNGNYGLNLPMGSPAPTFATDCSVSACTSYQDMANYDMNQWYTNITQGVALPRGNGKIEVVGAAPLLFDITVSWYEHDIPFSQKIKAQLP